MNILYFSRVNKDDPKNSGVVKKCEAQAAAFRRLGAAVDLVYLGASGVYKNESLIYRFPFPVLSRRWSSFLFYFFVLLKLVAQKVALENYQLLYIRYAMAHPLFWWFLQQSKKRNPSLKIMLEMPTFPYDQEPQGLAHRLSLQLDRRYRKKLHRMVDFISHYGLEKEIYGIPVIPLRNGIQAERIPLAHSKPIPGELRLIGVANWSYWHGMDRLIAGLGAYYEQESPKVKVSLKIVGGGRALEGYREQVKKMGLEKEVDFFAPTVGTALDELFAVSDMGIGCLGLFRKNVALDSSLKTREYCSRGLPFVYSGTDLDFPEDLFFVKKVAHREEAIAIAELVNFWEGIQKEKENWQEEIRAFALAHLSWEQQMGKILKH